MSLFKFHDDISDTMMKNSRISIKTNIKLLGLAEELILSDLLLLVTHLF